MKVKIIETLERVVEVDAATPADAIAKIEADYRDEEIVLDAEDHADTFICMENKEIVERLRTLARRNYGNTKYLPDVRKDGEGDLLPCDIGKALYCIADMCEE
jgi:hypothetical protein